MEPISEILARLPIPPSASAEARVPPWRRAAEAAYAAARAHTRDPASLPQLERICQLLRSHVVREWERDRIARRLARGCTRARASALLDFLISTVRRRESAERERSPRVQAEKRAG